MHDHNLPKIQKKFFSMKETEKKCLFPCVQEIPDEVCSSCVLVNQAFAFYLIDSNYPFGSIAEHIACTSRFMKG